MPAGNLTFLIKSFFCMTKKSRQKFKYLQNKKYLRPESSPLVKVKFMRGEIILNVQKKCKYEKSKKVQGIVAVIAVLKLLLTF